jgi:hypothetical protein
MDHNKGKVKWTVVLGTINKYHSWWKDNSPDVEDFQECWAPSTSSTQRMFSTKKEAKIYAKQLADDGYDKYEIRVQKYNQHKVKP